MINYNEEVARMQKKRDYDNNFYLTHKKESREYHRLRMRRLRAEDKVYQLKFRLYNQFRKAYNKYLNEKKIVISKGLLDYGAIIKKLGTCPVNRKDYHIDHIIPLSFFDLTNKEEIIKAWSPENLQWLPAKINLMKGNKLNFREVINGN
jgi:hypothetical protein